MSAESGVPPHLSRRQRKNKNAIYSIVQFISDPDAISVVPSSWINVDKNECAWPNGSADNFIRNGVAPDDSWKTYSVTVLRENLGKLIFNFSFKACISGK